MTHRDATRRDKRRLEWGIIEVVPGNSFVRIFGRTKSGVPVEVEFPCDRHELSGWVESLVRAHDALAENQELDIRATRDRIRQACGGGS